MLSTKRNEGAEKSFCYSQTSNSIVDNIIMCARKSEEEEGQEADQKTTESIQETVAHDVMAADKTDPNMLESLKISRPMLKILCFNCYINEILNKTYIQSRPS